MRKISLPWIALLGILFASHLSMAENVCPWMNKATASGALGGSATLELNPTADGGQLCTFQYQKDSVTHSLQIFVRPLKDQNQEMHSYQSRCTSPPVDLKGIGNEAVQCGADTTKDRGEQVIGRVRDQAFIVTISSSLVGDPSMTREQLQGKARDIAEQVAGSLF